MIVCQHSTNASGVCTTCNPPFAPAFPQPHLTDGEGRLKWPGLTLHDYFVGQALIGIIASPRLHETADGKAGETISEAVDAAFIYADKIMKRRERGNK